ncbi:MAG: pseudouridine synthase [bacterium]
MAKDAGGGALRLDRYLSDMGAGTRSELKKGIRAGLARVNGEIEKDPGRKVTEKDTVSFRGREIAYEKKVYYMLHKPAGVISATEDRRQKTVLDLIDEEDMRKDLFPVGRLDRDTEGLLLITNDGELAHALLSPARHVNKVYYAEVDGALTAEDAAAFEEGMQVEDDFRALPARLEVLSSGPEKASALVTVREGKFHQIKRMFKARGREVTRLKRLSMGPLALDEALLPGQWRRLTAEEIRSLKGEQADCI